MTGAVKGGSCEAFEHLGALVLPASLTARYPHAILVQVHGDGLRPYVEAGDVLLMDPDTKPLYMRPVLMSSTNEGEWLELYAGGKYPHARVAATAVRVLDVVPRAFAGDGETIRCDDCGVEAAARDRKAVKGWYVILDYEGQVPPVGYLCPECHEARKMARALG